MNNNVLYILIAMVIAVIAQATNTNLVSNTTFLLLLLLALGAYGSSENNRCNCYLNGQQRGFI